LCSVWLRWYSTWPAHTLCTRKRTSLCSFVSLCSAAPPADIHLSISCGFVVFLLRVCLLSVCLLSVCVVEILTGRSDPHPYRKGRAAFVQIVASATNVACDFGHCECLSGPRHCSCHLSQVSAPNDFAHSHAALMSRAFLINSIGLSAWDAVCGDVVALLLAVTVGPVCAYHGRILLQVITPAIGILVSQTYVRLSPCPEI
jgi:hypothetical protein